MTEGQERRSDQGLVRAIGVRGLAASIVNVTIGAGIFVLPAVVARDLGAAAPLAYLACALAMMLVVASFAMAGSRVSLTGGIYAYVEVAFGPLIGFVTGVLALLSLFAASAGVANALVSTVAVVAPAAASTLGKLLLLAAVYGALAAINIRGVRVGTTLVELITVAKLLPLVLLIVVGLTHVRPADLAIEWASMERVGTTSLVLIFAFMGIETALVPSGEIDNPARTVPRAIFLALATSTAVYLAIQLVAYVTLGSELGQHTDAPLVDVALRMLGPLGGTLMLIGGAVSMLGFLSGDALCSPRMLFAFARDGLMPSVLARLHPMYRTPSVAIATYMVLVWTLAAVGSFSVLVLIGNVAILAVYFLCCAAAIELRRRDVRTDGVPFNIPGGPVVPLAGCAVIVWLISHVSAREVVVTSVAVLIAITLYGARALRRRRHPQAAPLADVTGADGAIEN
jgi:amino acid transporter